MLIQPAQIADQINLAYRSGFWGGGSIQELFHNTEASQAASHPISGTHSIWEIALHITAWHNIFCGRINNLQTEYLYDDDWPASKPTTKKKWIKTLEELDTSIERLVARIKSLTIKDLNLVVPGRTFIVYEMLHGIPQHDQYHAGQVLILKRIIKSKN